MSGRAGSGRLWLLRAAPGEPTAMLLEDGRPSALYFDHCADRGVRPRLDEIWGGRLGPPAPDGTGRFVDLGAGGEAYIAWPAAVKRPPEGALLAFEIEAEGYAEKGPRLRLAAHPPEKVGLIDRAFDPLARLREDYPDAEPAPPMTLAAADDWLRHFWTMIADPVWALPAGGRVSFEPTRAMVAIDVDSGAARGVAGRRAVNAQAGTEIARALRLKALAGLIVIDPAGRERSGARLLSEGLAQGLGLGPGPPPQISLGTGLVTLSRRRRRRPLTEIAAAPQRRAVEAFCALERELAAQPGRRFRLHLPAEAGASLTAAARADLEARYGARFELAKPALPLPLAAPAPAVEPL